MPTAARKKRERVRVVVPEHLKNEVARLKAEIDALRPIVDGAMEIDNIRRQVVAGRRTLDALNLIIQNKEEHRDSMLQKAHNDCEAIRKHAGKIDENNRKAFKEHVEDVTKQLDSRKGVIEQEERQNERRAGELDELNNSLLERERVISEGEEALEKDRQALRREDDVLKQRREKLRQAEEAAQARHEEGVRLAGEAEELRVRLEGAESVLIEQAQQQDLIQQGLDSRSAAIGQNERSLANQQRQLEEWSARVQERETDTTQARQEADRVMEQGQKALAEAQRIGQEQGQREGRLQQWDAELRDLERRLEAGRRELQQAWGQYRAQVAREHGE